PSSKTEASPSTIAPIPTAKARPQQQVRKTNMVASNFPLFEHISVIGQQRNQRRYGDLYFERDMLLKTNIFFLFVYLENCERSWQRLRSNQSSSRSFEFLFVFSGNLRIFFLAALDKAPEQQQKPKVEFVLFV